MDAANHSFAFIASDIRQSLGEMETEINMKDIFFGLEDNKLTLLPPFEHKEPEDDDCGLPHHPIYSNYSKYLWTSHRRSGGVQIGYPPTILGNKKASAENARAAC